MAHEISMVSGRAEVFALGGMWHGLGQVVQTAQNRKEAEVLSGTDYVVQFASVFGQAPHWAPNMMVAIPDRVMQYRTKPDGSPVYLGTVSNKFQTIQNAQAWDAMDAILGESGAAYTSAGVLRDGRRVFIQARMPGEVVIAGDGPIQKYLTLANGHDGSLAFRLYFTATRIVCQNTLSASLRDADSGVTLRHIGGDVSARVREAAGVVGRANAYFAAVAARMDALAQAKADVVDVQRFIAEVYPDHSTGIGTRKVEHSRKCQRDDVMIAYGTAPGHAEIQGTWWGAVNAVTWHEDHGKWLGSTVKVERRVEAMAFGAGNDRKQQAFDLACDFAGVTRD